MANFSVACFKAALFVSAVGAMVDLPVDQEECAPAQVSLLQKAFQLHAQVADLDDEEGPNQGSKILIIGDSNAAFAGPYAGVQPQNTLQDACAGSTVSNKGDPGTKVSAWMAHGLLANAVNSQTGWTHVWLSIGGNDLSEDYGCGPNGIKKGAIKADITKLIAEIKKLTSAKIVLTGYSVTAADDTCSLADVRANVAAAMEEIAAVDSAVTYASIADASGGTLDRQKRASLKCDESVLTPAAGSPNNAKIGVPPCRGDKQFFMPDFIHLNAKGYAAAWMLPGVQKAFGCQSGNPPAPPNPNEPTTPPAPPNPNPTTPPANVACADHDASVGPSSGGAFATCAELIASPYNCNHAEYGAQVKAICPASCNCNAPGCCAGA